jgi:hypothetical protein
MPESYELLLYQQSCRDESGGRPCARLAQEDEQSEVRLAASYRHHLHQLESLKFQRFQAFFVLENNL